MANLARPNRVDGFIKGPYQAGHRVNVSGANWCESRGVARRTAHAIHEKRDKGCLTTVLILCAAAR